MSEVVDIVRRIAARQEDDSKRIGEVSSKVVVVVVTFFNHNFVTCKATLILAIKIYEIKYYTSLNDIHRGLRSNN